MDLQVRLILASSFDEAGLPESIKRPGVNIFHYLSPNLSIDDARSISARLGSKPLGDGSQTIIVFTKRMTVESQNALLKSFEEPLANTTLILIVPDESLLLPTLRSRFTTVERSAELNDEQLAQEFITMSYKERLDLVADKVKAKDTGWMMSLISSINKYVSTSAVIKNNKVVLESLNMTAVNLRNRGASQKMLLENLALSLPIVS